HGDRPAHRRRPRRRDRRRVEAGRGDDRDDSAASQREHRGQLGRLSHAHGGDSVSGSRILIVDDEKSLRDMLGLLFHRQGLEVLTAANYTEGVAAAIRSNPDVILCDIKMPDGNGLDLLSRVREEKLPTPVIMITAHTSTEDAIQAMKRGAVDYISKPFNNDELLLVVRRALGEKQLQDENLYLR